MYENEIDFDIYSSHFKIDFLISTNITESLIIYFDSSAITEVLISTFRICGLAVTWNLQFSEKFQ